MLVVKSQGGTFTFVPGLLGSRGRDLSRERAGSDLGSERPPPEFEEGEGLAELVEQQGGHPGLKEWMGPRGCTGCEAAVPPAGTGWFWSAPRV